jgi:hypothetical protein
MSVDELLKAIDELSEAVRRFILMDKHTLTLDRIPKNMDCSISNTNPLI